MFPNSKKTHLLIVNLRKILAPSQTKTFLRERKTKDIAYRVEAHTPALRSTRKNQLKQEKTETGVWPCGKSDDYKMRLLGRSAAKVRAGEGDRFFGKTRYEVRVSTHFDFVANDKWGKTLLLIGFSSKGLLCSNLGYRRLSRRLVDKILHLDLPVPERGSPQPA